MVCLLLVALPRNQWEGLMAVQDPATVTRAKGRICLDPTRPDLVRLKEVLCDPSRLRIVQALDGEAVTVGTLAAAIGQRLPATSQHLRVLRDIGVVTAQRCGTTVTYQLRGSQTTRQILELVQSLVTHRLGTLDDSPGAAPAP
jgi:ArsR family transcriptional regulator